MWKVIFVAGVPNHAAPEGSLAVSAAAALYVKTGPADTDWTQVGGTGPIGDPTLYTIRLSVAAGAPSAVSSWPSVPGLGLARFSLDTAPGNILIDTSALPPTVPANAGWQGHIVNEYGGVGPTSFPGILVDGTTTQFVASDAAIPDGNYYILLTPNGLIS